MTITPEQFNKLATKDDLKDFVTKEEFNKKTDQILYAVDGIAKNFQDHKIEHIANQAAHDRFEERITELENR